MDTSEDRTKTAYDVFRELRAGYLMAHAKISTEPGSQNSKLLDVRDDLRRKALAQATGDARAMRDKLVMLLDLAADDGADPSSPMAVGLAALIEDVQLLMRSERGLMNLELATANRGRRKHF
jgi:hypothetical protein